MEATARWRGLSLDGYLGGVALPTCADIGADIWIKPQWTPTWRGKWEGPYLVVDCARRGDIYGVVVHRGEVVEVDWPTARRWGMVTPRRPCWINETLYKEHCIRQWRMSNVYVSKIPPQEISEDAFFRRYRHWWISQLEFAAGYERPPLYYPGENTWRIDGEKVAYYARSHWR